MLDTTVPLQTRLYWAKKNSSGRAAMTKALTGRPPSRERPSFDQAPAGEMEEDVLEGAPAYEHALRHEPALAQAVRGRVPVVGIEENPVGERLHARGEAVRPRRDVHRCRLAEAELDHLAGRVALDELARRPLGGDPALVHDDEPVAELLRLVHVVRRQEERHPAPFEPVEPVPDDVPGLRVEPGRRLVEQEHFRVVDERAGDGQAPLHPARERLDAVVRPLRELDELEQLIRPLAELAPGEAEVAAVDEDVLADGQVAVE